MSPPNPGRDDPFDLYYEGPQLSFEQLGEYFRSRGIDHPHFRGPATPDNAPVRVEELTVDGRPITVGEAGQMIRWAEGHGMAGVFSRREGPARGPGEPVTIGDVRDLMSRGRMLHAEDVEIRLPDPNWANSPVGRAEAIGPDVVHENGMWRINEQTMEREFVARVPEPLVARSPEELAAAFGRHGGPVGPRGHTGPAGPPGRMLMGPVTIIPDSGTAFALPAPHGVEVRAGDRLSVGVDLDGRTTRVFVNGEEVAAMSQGAQPIGPTETASLLHSPISLERTLERMEEPGPLGRGSIVPPIRLTREAAEAVGRYFPLQLGEGPELVGERSPHPGAAELARQYYSARNENGTEEEMARVRLAPWDPTARDRAVLDSPMGADPVAPGASPEEKAWRVQTIESALAACRAIGASYREVIAVMGGPHSAQAEAGLLDRREAASRACAEEAERSGHFESQLMALFEAGLTFSKMQEIASRHSDWGATPEEVAAATEEYETDEVEVDPHGQAIASRGDDGVWVSSWTWVRYEDHGLVAPGEGGEPDEEPEDANDPFHG